MDGKQKEDSMKCIIFGNLTFCLDFTKYGNLFMFTQFQLLIDSLQDLKLVQCLNMGYLWRRLGPLSFVSKFQVLKIGPFLLFVRYRGWFYGYDGKGLLDVNGYTIFNIITQCCEKSAHLQRCFEILAPRQDKGEEIILGSFYASNGLTFSVIQHIMEVFLYQISDSVSGFPALDLCNGMYFGAVFKEGLLFFYPVIIIPERVE